MGEALLIKGILDEIRLHQPLEEASLLGFGIGDGPDVVQCSLKTANQTFSLSICVGPRVDDFDAGVSKLACVSCDHGQSATGRRCRQKGVRQVVVERFAPSPFFFHDAGARLGVGQGPIECSPLEKPLREDPETARQDPLGAVRD